MQQQLESRPHYPFVTRLLIDLFNAGELPNVHMLTVEPLYGHVGRVGYHNGSVRMFRGATIGANNHGAAEIARDKGYTKFFLQRLGYATPTGKVFLLPSYLRRIDDNLSRYGFDEYAPVETIADYIDATIGYPCYVKPNDGSRGRGVTRCEDIADVQAVIMKFERSGGEVMLVEEAIAMPDYRVVVWRDRVVACYLRRPLTVIGDGRATINELLARKRAEWKRAGRRVMLQDEEPRLLRKLQRRNQTLDSIPDIEEAVPLADISNLSRGGDAEDWSERIHPAWRDLCIRLTAEMGLQLCGIDIACTDISDPRAAYSILEINDSPGMDNYAASGAGPAAVVRNLYQSIFNESMPVS